VPDATGTPTSVPAEAPRSPSERYQVIIGLLPSFVPLSVSMTSSQRCSTQANPSGVPSSAHSVKRRQPTIVAKARRVVPNAVECEVNIGDGLHEHLELG
jgi:hypothetical protein